MSKLVELLFGEERGFSARRFRARQGAFLLVFTIIGILGIVIIYRKISHDASLDKGINVAGMQRTLTERATRLAISASAADDVQARQSAVRESLLVLEQMKATHALISQGMLESGTRMDVSPKVVNAARAESAALEVFELELRRILVEIQSSRSSRAVDVSPLLTATERQVDASDAIAVALVNEAAEQRQQVVQICLFIAFTFVFGMYLFWRLGIDAASKRLSLLFDSVSSSNGALLTQAQELERALTELKVAERNSAHVSAMLRTALDGIAHLDEVGMYTFVNPSYAQTLRTTPENLIGKHWESTLDPSEFDRMAEAYETMIAEGKVQVETLGRRFDTGESFHKEVVMVRNVHDGLFQGHFCVMRDIDEMKRENLRVAEQEALLRTMSENVPLGIFVTEANGDCTYANSRYLELTGRTLEQVRGKEWVNAIHPDDRDLVFETWYESAANGIPYLLENRYIKPNGDIVWVRVSATELRMNGEITGYVGSVLDITDHRAQQEQIEQYMLQMNENNLQLEMQQEELTALNAKLETLARTDGLTGLLNHRTFQEQLSNQLSRVGEHQPLAVILLDVDHFKSFNDTYGHPAGDVVLKSVAQCITEAVRKVDIVARYGGEEFAVILPNANWDVAAVVAERIRVTVESHPWLERQVTVSVGAVCVTSQEHPKVIVASADNALYASKHGGRNRVTLARDHEQAA